LPVIGLQLQKIGTPDFPGALAERLGDLPPTDNHPASARLEVAYTIAFQKHLSDADYLFISQGNHRIDA
jgi:hypothetical protein